MKKEQFNFDLNNATIEQYSEDGPKHLTGYAAVYDAKSRARGNLFDHFSRGSFDNSLAGDYDIKALFDHDYGKVLGRVGNGTLSLSQDEFGLKVDIIPPNTQFGRDMIELVNSGYLDKMSLTVNIKSYDLERRDDGGINRYIKDVEIYEVSIVTEPAFTETSISTKSFSLIEKELASTEFKNTDVYKFKLGITELESEDSQE